MNRNQINNENADMFEEEAVKPRYSRVASVVAAVVCLLLAIVFWSVIMNSEDSDYLTVKAPDETAEYAYSLSETSLQVEGRVFALRHAKIIDVRLPEGVTEGDIALNEDDLILPEGVHLAKPLYLTLTVRKK